MFSYNRCKTNKITENRIITITKLKAQLKHVKSGKINNINHKNTKNHKNTGQYWNGFSLDRTENDKLTSN